MIRTSLDPDRVGVSNCEECFGLTLRPVEFWTSSSMMVVFPLPASPTMETHLVELNLDKI